MPSTIQDTLYETFLAITAGGGQIPGSMADGSEELATSVDNAANVMSSVAATWESVAPVAMATRSTTPVANGSPDVMDAIASTVLNGVIGMNPVSSLVGAGSTASTGGGITDTLENVGMTVLKSGFGVLPLLGSIFGLFGGSDSETPPPLVKYALPPSIAFQAGEANGVIGASDYDQSGMARVAPPVSGAAGGSANGAPQITVNVQAMDARSFLDRSGDIAAAVRDAMLNLNSINDVVNDL